jgi:hypothetical protein
LNIQVTDSQGVVPVCPDEFLRPDPSTNIVSYLLNAGQSMTCTGSGIAVAGQYSNMGIATGEPPSGRTVQDRDPSYYFGGLENKPESSESS